MTTLIEYATTHFPNHVTDHTNGDLSLTEHTAVAHVVGSDNAEQLMQRVRRALPAAEVAAIVMRPTDPTVVPDGGEDPEGVIDLPHRRIAASAIVGAIVVGAAVGIVVGIVTDSLPIGLIVGVFAAIIGGTIAGIAGGGARYGGERAWEQPHAPDRTVAVVAALTTTERDALAAARLMEETDPYEVRIVSADGAWHSPNT